MLTIIIIVASIWLSVKLIWFGLKTAWRIAGIVAAFLLVAVAIPVFILCLLFGTGVVLLVAIMLLSAIGIILVSG